MNLAPTLFRLLPGAAAMLTLLVAPACSRRGHDVATGAPTSAPLRVETARVALATLPRAQELAATVRPTDRAVVAARASGAILRADFALGQGASAGEVLVTLESAEAAAAVSAAEASLAQVAGDFARESALLAKGASASDTVRSLADRRAASAAALEAARARLAYSRIAAPFAGVVTRKFVNTGDLASPGLPLFEIEGRGGLRAECEVPGSLPSPALGAAIAVRLADGHAVAAKLAEFSTAADPLTRTRLAKLDLPADAAARYGDFVRVSWPAGEIAALVVPAAALSPLGQMERVFVVSEGHARLRLVKTAGADSAGIRVAAGLDAGELVILAPPSALRDGQPVEIAP